MDETGQDPVSSVFVVVVVVSAENQEDLRQTLMNIEDAAGTGRRKWHKRSKVARLFSRSAGLAQTRGSVSALGDNFNTDNLRILNTSGIKPQTLESMSAPAPSR